MSAGAPGADASPRGDPRTVRGRERATGSRPKILAFYLPQFHPIPENDEWWEPGFTEWTNVATAKPLFPGHNQPHLPGELGYYDLRVPEVREKQAALARQYGIFGFVYYHYWFHGRRLLERPFDEVLSSGQPDFPFALCWANEEWTRNWDAQSGNVLVEQRFSEADDLAHIRWLVRAFSDERYIKIDGRPLMLVYRSDLLPDPKRTTDRWRAHAMEAGFPDLYLAMVQSRRKDDDPRPMGFDAAVGFGFDAAERLAAPVDAYRDHLILDYNAAAEAALRRPKTPWKRFPGVMAGWDNTARRRSGAIIFDGATPEAYEQWLRRAIESVADVREEEKLVFVTAWNEWAEGNHLEPDRRYGRSYLEATCRAVEDEVAPGDELPPTSGHLHTTDVTGDTTTLDLDSTAGHALRVVREVIADPRRVVEIGDATPGIASAFENAGIGYRAIATDTGADADALLKRLDDEGDVGALLLASILDRWPDPHRLLAALSKWACDHGSPPLVVSVANVAHFDIGLLLLCGRWDPSDDALGDSPVRYFTRVTLERLLQRCGWRIAASDDHESIFSPRYQAVLSQELPEVMAGALRVMAQSYNPDWAVEHFVWALAPVGVDEPPASYAEAVGDLTDTAVVDLPTNAPLRINEFLSSVGLLASESHLRGEDRSRRERIQRLRKSIQQGLVELALPKRWTEELPLLSDVVDDLAELYLARSDLANAFDDNGIFDAEGYVKWAIGEQPMVAAAVSRLAEGLRRETTKAIRAALTAPNVDQLEVEAATDELVDIYLHRPDIRFTGEDGATLDMARFLGWATSVQDTDDSSAARLAPYRALIAAALAGPPAPRGDKRHGLGRHRHDT